MAGRDSDRDEHLFLVEFVTVLNQQIEVAARLEGVHYMQPALFAFEDADVWICDGDSPSDTAMNLIALQPTEGDIGARLDPSKWIHGSMHPGPEGHRLTAEVLKSHLPAIIASGTNPPPSTTARLEVSGLRQSRPVAVDPRDLDGAPCGANRQGAFAQAVVLVDQENDDGTRYVPTLTFPDARTDAADTEVCVRLGAGEDAALGRRRTNH